jgi:purine-binding chemotaxis protein CheW
MNQRLNDSIDSIDGNKAAQLRQDFDRTFALPPSLAAPEVEDLLAIRVAGDPYAIRLLDIAEIVTDRSVVSVPSVTPDLLGLAGIRGGIVPVFGLSSILGYGPDPGTPRWMILCGSEEPIALAFAEFEGYLRLPASALHADENFRATHEHVKYVNQVARTPDGVRAVISIPLIMATIRNRISQHRPTKET